MWDDKGLNTIFEIKRNHNTFQYVSEIVTQRCSVIKMFLKILQTARHLYRSLFFNKVIGLRPVTLSKMILRYRCFPMNYVKFLRTTFFIEHLRWLLLRVSQIGWTAQHKGVGNLLSIWYFKTKWKQRWSSAILLCNSDRYVLVIIMFFPVSSFFIRSKKRLLQINSLNDWVETKLCNSPELP